MIEYDSSKGDIMMKFTKFKVLTDHNYIEAVTLKTIE